MARERVAENITSPPQLRPVVASIDRASAPPRCWCGNDQLEPFNPDYARCGVCQTLVLIRPPAQSDPHVIDDKADFYGRDYWFKYQNELGYGNIVQRSRSDLHDRCLHWLAATLRHKLPPGKSLELGSAHGGFVATMAWAGFDATGLELSPAIVQFATETFHVPMLLGPLEDQKLRKKSLDVIAHMDVLEHLPDPVATMSRAVSLLKDDGIMVVQTPCYPEGATLEDLTQKNHAFLQQLKPVEHLYLFSKSSIAEFFNRLGMTHHIFEPAIFAHYDMFLIAGKSPLRVHSREEQSAALAQAPAGRAMLALLDLKEQSLAADLRLGESESDRAARLDVIHRQGHEVARLQAEVHKWLESSTQLQAETRRLQAELDGKKDIERQFRESEADRAARLEVINKQGHEIADLQAQVHKLLESSKHLQAEADGKKDIERQFRQSEADRAARLEVIIKQGHEIADLQAQVHKWLESCKQLQVELQQKIEVERQLRQSGRDIQLHTVELQQRSDSQNRQNVAERTALIDSLNQSREESARIAQQLKSAQTEIAGLQTAIAEQSQKSEAMQNQLDRDLSQSRQEVARLEQALRENRAESDRLAAALRQNESERGDDRAINSLFHEELQLLSRQAETLQTALRSIQGGVAYRLLRRLGLFRSADQILVDSLASNNTYSWKPAAPGVILRTLENCCDEIDKQLSAAPDSQSLADLRQYHWNTVDELNKIRPLAGKNVLDIGVRSPGYSLQRVLHHGAALYAGVGREVGMPQLVVPPERQRGAGLLLNMDPANLTFQDETFDAAISINAIPRIGNVSATLRQLHRVLRGGAAALFVFEPVWSCSYGHQLHGREGFATMIPPWAHLRWSEETMRRELRERWPADAPTSLDEAIQWIYRTGPINRMHVAALRQALSAGPLLVEWIVPLFDPAPDEAMLEKASQATGISRDDLTIRGLSVMLIKK
jgi:SAM-dependent methyltransferase